jgi:ribosomal protein L18E
MRGYRVPTRSAIAGRAEAPKIGRHDVEIEHKGRRMKIKNDAVIVGAGRVLPTAFLTIGVEVETKYGTA